MRITMKYKEFLIENNDSYKTNLSLEDAIKLIKENCDVTNFLYRGYKSSQKYLHIDSNKSERKSANTSNHYTVLIDTFLEDKFPLRSKSIICTNDIEKAKGYGYVYVVLPYKNAKVASVGDPDIWDKEVKIGTMNLPIYTYNHIFESLGISSESYKLFMKGLKEVVYKMRKTLIELAESDDEHDVFMYVKKMNIDIDTDYFDGGKKKIKVEDDVSLYVLFSMFGLYDDIYTIIEDAYSSDNLGFELITKKPKSNYKNEYWIGGQSIMVLEHYWNEFLKEYNK